MKNARLCVLGLDARAAMRKALIRQRPTVLCSDGLYAASVAQSARSAPSHVVQPYIRLGAAFGVCGVTLPLRFRSPKFCSSTPRLFNNNSSSNHIRRESRMTALSPAQSLSPAAGLHFLPKCGLPAMQANAAGNLDRHPPQKQKLPAPPAGTPLRDICALLNDKVSVLLESEPSSKLLRDVQRQTEISLGVLKEAVEKYGVGKVALSYNGGKDCLVLLVLWLVALYRHCSPSLQNPPANSENANSIGHGHHELLPDSIESAYVQVPNSFQEVDDFVRDSARQYHLDLHTFTTPMKTAFGDYLRLKPNIELIFVGTRRTDPHGAALTHFNATDGDWPRFMRCHPVIDWRYREIWEFIRQLEIPYCELYDAGFTSLGGTEDTHPNPKLKINNSISKDGGPAQYRPAFELTEDDEERLGRHRP